MTAQDTPGYDAFISYSHRDRAWVDSHLLVPLDQAGLRIAIDYRDFEVGPFAQENMENCVDASRHVLLVMSPNWIESEWSSFEYLFASASDPAARRRKLIPILIAPTELPRRLSVRTYADFRDPAAYEAEMSKVVRALLSNEGPDNEPAAGAASPTPVLRAEAAPLVFSNWKTDLSDLLVRSGKSHFSARTALCIQIGVDPNDLTFAEVAPRNFAVQLVAMLDESGNSNALLSLCGAIQPVLKGSFATRLQTVQEMIRRQFGT
jgi:TIR domain-containing protein